MKLKLPFFVLVLLSAAFLFDGTGFMRFSLAAALLHEAGHIAVFALVTKGMPSISFNAGGISLNCNTAFLNKKHDIAVTLGGPFINIIIFLICIVLIEIKASIRLYFFAATNIFFAILNLLPFSFLDGGRIAELIVPVQFIVQYKAISRIIGAAVISVGSFFVFNEQTQISFKISGVLFCIYFFVKTFGDKLQ